MARIRTVKPEFWTDEKVVMLSPWARLAFIGLWNFVDDSGRAVCSPLRLKMQIFPADTVDFRELLAELSAAHLIQIYTVDGIEYLQVCGFTRHQKIDPRWSPRLPGPRHPLSSQASSSTDAHQSPPNSTDFHQPPPTSTDLHQPPPEIPLGREWNGKERNGKKDAAPSAAPLDPSPGDIAPSVPAHPPPRAPAPLAPDAELYARGREVLGANSGGLVKKLVVAKGGSIPLARAAIEQASTKANPREYLGAAIRGRDSPDEEAQRLRGDRW